MYCRDRQGNWHRTLRLLEFESVETGVMKYIFASSPVVARCVGLLCVLLAAALLAPPTRSQQIPATQAKAIDGSSVSFPDASSGKPLLLLVGFSHQSSGRCQAWDKRLAPIYLDDSRILYFQAADFQGVPSLVMKMILHGMKKEIPANEHSRFVLLQSNEDEWKSAAKFSAPDDAYLILTNPAGHIVWQTHGEVTDEQFAALQAAIKTQLGN
jgi:hypothetical protein